MDKFESFNFFLKSYLSVKTIFPIIDKTWYVEVKYGYKNRIFDILYGN